MKPGFTIARGQLDSVEAFLRVAEQRSFRAAAIDLRVSPSAISQAVRALEQRVGVPLLSRTTRSVGLTEAGARFLEHARPAMADLERAFRAAQALGEEPSGTLRITLPRPILTLIVEPVIGDFCAAYPEVLVELHGDDGFVDLSANDFDAGIRLGEYLQADMVAVRLTRPVPFALVGSPDYLARFGRPRHPDELQQHRCIRVRSAGGTLPAWPFLENGKPLLINPPTALVFNDYAHNISAAARGIGLALGGEPLSRAYVEDGRLERVLADYTVSTPGAYLYYPNRSQILPKLRVFVDYLRRNIPAEFAV